MPLRQTLFPSSVQDGWRHDCGALLRNYCDLPVFAFYGIPFEECMALVVQVHVLSSYHASHRTSVWHALCQFDLRNALGAVARHGADEAMLMSANRMSL